MKEDAIILKVKKWILYLNGNVRPVIALKSFHKLMLDSLNITVQPCKVKIPIPVKWIVPPSGKLKLNIYETFLKETRSAGGGGVCRDERGRILFAFSISIMGESPLEAEVKALLTGLKYCYIMGLENVLVETDCKILVDWYGGKAKTHIYFLNIWEDVIELCENVGLVMLHVWREQNKVADLLAKRGVCGISESYWSERELPKDVYGNYQMDIGGIVSFRRK